MLFLYFCNGLNPYIYTYQNPVLYVDPNGKQNVSAAVSGYKANAVHAGNVAPPKASEPSLWDRAKSWAFRRTESETYISLHSSSGAGRSQNNPRPGFFNPDKDKLVDVDFDGIGRVPKEVGTKTISEAIYKGSALVKKIFGGEEKKEPEVRKINTTTSDSAIIYHSPVTGVTIVGSANKDTIIEVSGDTRLDYYKAEKIRLESVSKAVENGKTKDVRTL